MSNELNEASVDFNTMSTAEKVTYILDHCSTDEINKVYVRSRYKNDRAAVLQKRKDKYLSDPEFRERCKNRALQRYYNNKNNNKEQE